MLKGISRIDNRTKPIPIFETAKIGTDKIVAKHLTQS
jgi:hypothetical protein